MPVSLAPVIPKSEWRASPIPLTAEPSTATSIRSPYAARRSSTSETTVSNVEGTRLGIHHRPVWRWKRATGRCGLGHGVASRVAVAWVREHALNYPRHACVVVAGCDLVCRGENVG